MPDDKRQKGKTKGKNERPPRRFEPRFGVSRPMLEHQARHVTREVEDYSLLSLNDLRGKLADRRAEWARAHDELEVKLRLFRQPELAALQCLVVRDCCHLLELYLTYLRLRMNSGNVPDHLPSAITREEDAPKLPFSDFLFGEPK